VLAGYGIGKLASGLTNTRLALDTIGGGLKVKSDAL
jgi:hypothetical protein